MISQQVLKNIHHHVKKIHINSYVAQIGTKWWQRGKNLDTQNLGKINMDDQQPRCYSLNNYFFRPLNQTLWVPLIQGLWILMNMPSMNLVQAWNFAKFVPNTTHSYVVGHRISFPITSLMQNAMKMASSQIRLLYQFHVNASYMIMFHI
jgi:hypothetical protein